MRDQKIMPDFDLAKLYGVETKVLNQAVKRNPGKFPKDFMFRLTKAEWKMMRSQNLTALKTTSTMRSQNVTASQKKRNIGLTPYAFTEHGVTMAATILRSKKVVKMSIAVVRVFAALKRFVLLHKDLAIQLKECVKNCTTGSANMIHSLPLFMMLLKSCWIKRRKTRNRRKRPRIGFRTKNDAYPDP